MTDDPSEAEDFDDGAAVGEDGFGGACYRQSERSTVSVSARAVTPSASSYRLFADE